MDVVDVMHVIATSLKIRITETNQKLSSTTLTCGISTFAYKAVSDEVREQFKKELNNHLFDKCIDLDVGTYIDYSFECGNVRPLGRIMENANCNLAEVLVKLPELGRGQTYSLPSETYIGFTVIEKHSSKGIKVKWDYASPWIIEKYKKQQ